MSRTATKQIDVNFDELAEQMVAELSSEYAEDLDIILDFLREARESRNPVDFLMRYRYRPIGPQEFVESKAYMDKAGVLWPKVMEEFVELNSGRYVEAVLTGAIGVAKTTIALYTQAYQLYRLSCLRDPHKEFDLDRSSEIVTIFQSLNEKLARSVDYERFRDMIAKAPYFKRQFRFDEGRLSEMIFPNRIIVKPVAGHDAAAIGQNVIGGIIDEVDFMAMVENSKLTRDGSVYDQAAQNYNSIARRRESRFMQKGALPGMLCLVSSKNYPGGLTDRKQAEARTDKRIFVYDKRLWDVRPERFCGENFRVFVGDETRKPRIMEDDEVVTSEEDQRLVVAIPIENRHAFENDLLKAIRDIAGVSTQALHPFMLNTEAVSKCFGMVQSIASREDCDYKATQIIVYPKRILNPNEPRFAHIDLALSKDSAGISIGHVPGFRHVNRGDFQETLPIIHFDLILEVRPPRGGEIEFENIRRMMYRLRDTVLLPIKWVSFDQFQSQDSMQIMKREGFVVGYQSMDTTTDAYDMAKQAFYDDRVIAPAHAKAQKEMCTLEFDAKRQKIDHPPQGSKDVSDSMAGVVFGITMRREIWLRHQVPLSRIPHSLNEIISRHSITAQEKKPPASYMDRLRAERGVIGISGNE